MNRFFRNTGFYLLIFLVTVGIVNFILSGTDKVGKLTYQEFRVQLKADNVTELALRPENGTYRVEGTLAKAIPGQESNKFFTNVPLYDSDVVKLVEEKIDAQKMKNVAFNPAEGNSIWLTFLTSIIPFVIIFILFFFLLNNAQGGGSRVMNFGKSRAKLYNEEKKRVTFDDVAGADEEKAELEEVVDFLKDNRKFNAVGARIPKGVLLVGPPGTGKTLLARAVAGEAGVPFFSISGSDFVEMFVGVGASRVRDLFENAKKNAPCIIFIDEIDAVGRQRGAGLGGGHDEREQTLNQLLVEMDGFGGNEGIIMIAATNRPDILDPALLRPGRFDRQITVDRPDIKGREAVLKVHARNKPIGEDVKLDVIARGTSGFTGADLENLLNEAALLTARRNKKQITMTEVDEAIDRVIAGPAKKSRVVSEDERRLVAFHEAGHTIIGYHLRNAEMVHKVTIIPRGQAGGYTVMLPKEDRFFATKSDLLDKIVGLLGGRVAEELVLGDISTGAHNDFQRATAIARSMITEYGMSKLGPMQFGKSQGQVFLGRDYGNERNYSDKIAYEIDLEMQNIINECYAKCTELLTKHRDQLDLIANTLLRVETLDAEQIKQLIETGKMDNDPDANKDVVVNIQPKLEEVKEEPKQEDTQEDTNEEPKQ
ncbi:ATP-dependent zinc metalloprotease FtsH [Brevibacillus sp. M2.1A]|uniref:ATP-dependent zinc metalloprotease FtsH n=1 Tax=Brevibacillus TaxID=55080 RepID=UPI00156AECDF|nr:MULTISPECIES: ATP-dependent zinc metalloprotease FtsH [Brevibacillus]MCC8433635.1 ATP-dependent zinc metalloprotease FtsH [Brevibacillus sp. M2.1A]MCE0452639.1 ATP-dependent zinc metalloprotease FtsH [Brevibacillus sp. AF8]MCM3145626.1 ATP-dependent zinc metalloprotease FtsH [Brevibacillus sp. MER 51]UKK96094.1 ATP-dependent metallopeptidase FtsH/Yme1/Tma family protein [Brevibacillus brevis]